MPLWMIRKNEQNRGGGKMITRSFVNQCRLLICILTFTVSSVASAISFTDIYIFGDSLSDTDVGVSNGPLWPEYLSPQLGLTYNSATNFAVAGATSFELVTQVSAYQSTVPTADPNALYVVWAGGNDILAGGSGTVAANNVIANVSSLSSFGANYFLVPNLPDLGLIPADGTGTLTLPSIDFNSTIESAYAGIPTAVVADVFGLHHEALTDPTAFGLTNATDSCFFTAPLECDTYLFWDLIHPTTVGHGLIADEFEATLATIPIPAAVWLFASGLIGLIGVARRKKA